MDFFDPYDPSYFRDGVPFDRIAELRRRQPVSRTPKGWYLLRRRDAEALLRDVDHFGSDMTSGTGLDGVEAVPEEQLFLPEIGEPLHGRIRKLYNSVLGPHRTNQLAPFIRAACDGLVEEALATDGPVDLHERFAVPIPSIVMAEILGLPRDAADKFHRWSLDGSVMLRPACPSVGPEGLEIQRYLAEQVGRYRAGELDSHTLRVFVEADVDGEPLTDVQIVHQLQTFVLGGVHTTRGLLVHAVQRLVCDPGLFERLDADRALIPVFVEESLRHDSPAQRVTRRCLRSAELAGLSFEPGDWVEVGIASANRDEADYEEPEDFRLDRPDPRDHLAFGGGPHVCPGAAVARLEAVTAVETLLDRCASLRPVDGHSYPPVPGNLGYAPVPARLVARASAAAR